MSILPDNRFLRCRFYAPIGVEGVSVERGIVSGRFSKSPTRFYGDKEKTLAERFANWGWKEVDIELFTRRYGPLTGNIRTGTPLGPISGNARDGFDCILTFTFTLESWRDSQWEFRKFWGEIKRGTIGEYQPLEGNTLEIRKRWLHFRCSDLWTFMTLELLSRPERVRYCERPDCPHPYFVAQHGKERYCSIGCANWSQSQLKKRWHEQQRQKRLADAAKRHRTRGGHSGPRKTR